MADPARSHPHAPGECGEVFALLSAYLDAELPAATCQEIEEHLAGCPPCIEFLESLRRTIGLCREFRAEAQPSPLTAEARRELESAWRRLLAARGAEHPPAGR